MQAGGGRPQEESNLLMLTRLWGPRACVWGYFEFENNGPIGHPCSCGVALTDSPAMWVPLRWAWVSPGRPGFRPGSLPPVEPGLHHLGPTVACTLPPVPSPSSPLQPAGGVPDCRPVTTTPTRRHLFAGSAPAGGRGGSGEAGRNVPNSYRAPHPHSTDSETEL